ncbi:MAG: GNAT family N-acetyltransferase [Ignavibacteria bacterium]|nr:GNAT family N-acetyltransferase [Ignavibacteria bacterium]
MEITIARFSSGDEFKVSKLVHQVFNEFVSADCTPDGRAMFYDWINPEFIARRQKEGRYMLIAYVEGTMAGVIEMRDKNHIALLFVLTQFQGNGIARRLFEEAKQYCIEKYPGISGFTVFASLYSVNIYRALGFIPSAEVQEQNGIRFIPMAYQIPQANK